MDKDYVNSAPGCVWCLYYNVCDVCKDYSVGFVKRFFVSAILYYCLGLTFWNAKSLFFLNESQKSFYLWRRDDQNSVGNQQKIL